MASVPPGAGGPGLPIRATARPVPLSLATALIAQPGATGPAEGTVCPLARPVLRDRSALPDSPVLPGSLVRPYRVCHPVRDTTRPGPWAVTADLPARLGLAVRLWLSALATAGWLRPAGHPPGQLLSARRAGPLLPTQDPVGTGRLARPM